MPSTDRVLSLIQVASEIRKVLRFNELHALTIKSLDRLVNDRFVGEAVRELEVGTPVAKVTRDDKYGLLIEEKRKEKFSVATVLGLGDLTNHEWHEFEVSIAASIFEHLLNERNMHLQAVFIFFDLFTNRRNLQTTFCVLCILTKARNGLLVDSDVPEGCRPLLTRCRPDPVEKDLVRRANKHDPFISYNLLRQILVRPCGCRSAIGKASMRSNDRLEFAAICRQCDLCCL